MEKKIKSETVRTLKEITDLYLRDIRKFTPLSREEEASTLNAAHAGDEKALHHLVTANLRFVVRVAGEYTGRGLALSDLIAEGNVGLMRATKTFDPSRGHKFITYAVWWIRQAILSALNRQTHPVVFPVNQLDDRDIISKTSGSMSQRLERVPDMDEIAEETQFSLRRVSRALITSQSSISFDKPLYDDGVRQFSDIFLDGSPEPDEIVHTAHLHNRLRESLSSLPEREAEIINRYFGLDVDDSESLEQVGRRFQISRERVRQLKDRALNRIRQHLDVEEPSVA
jgi:RNA polymerase primary sigma factor